MLLSNQDKGCTPSVAHSLALPLDPALLNLWNENCIDGGIAPDQAVLLLTTVDKYTFYHIYTDVIPFHNLKEKRQRNGFWESYTPEINQLKILRFVNVKMNHFWSAFDGFIKSSRFQNNQDGHSICFFFLIKRLNGECNVRNFRLFLFGMSSDVPAIKVCVFISDFNFSIGVN